MPVGDHRRGTHDRGRHGHDHAATKATSKPRRPSSSASNRKTSVASQRDVVKSAKSAEQDRQVTKSPDELELRSLTNDSLATKEEELVYPNGQIDTNNDTKTEESGHTSPEPEMKEEKSAEKWAEKSTDEYNIRSFNDNILEFTEIFDNDKFRTVDSAYPVEDLISVVNSVSTAIDEFKEQTLASQSKLEGLREKMKEVKEAIHHNIAKNAVQLPDDEVGVEERELTEKLTRLNAEVAKANADLSEALRLSAETESTAVRAQLAAERAKEEAKRIEEELELKSKVEAKRKVEHQKKMEALQKQKEEEDRMELEARKQKEIEWKRKEMNSGEKGPVWEKWPTHEINIVSDAHEIGVGCMVRGNPSKFDQSQLELQVVDQMQCRIAYETQEELVSCVLTLTNKANDQQQFEEPIFVAVPFQLSRSSASSREPFIKAEINGEWKEIPSREVTFENFKDVKFAQAEIKGQTTLAVMTRYKRDYVTLSKRPAKIVSSYDHRVTLTLQKDTFNTKELFRMQVQPVDSATINDMQTRRRECKGLLTSSPIIHADWETNSFAKPITVTLPCPPNPAKARKLAQIRKMKEEKMKHPVKAQVIDYEKEARKEEQKKKAQQQKEAQMTEEDKVTTKWYMGEYGHNDDDENDLLHFLSMSHTGKWTFHPEINVQQVKLDLLQFTLTQPFERFIVLRTRTNIAEENTPPIASAIFEFLSKRFAQVIVKQRSDDPFDCLINVVPVSKTQKVLKRLHESGYDDGPDPSSIVNINEGDVIEVSFRGNITNSKEKTLRLRYNSNLKSEIAFYASEVDQYLQKNFNVFRGVVQLERCYVIKPDRKLKRSPSVVDESSVQSAQDTKKELLCEISINIPKYHIEPAYMPVAAPVTIITTTDPVDDGLIRDLARDMGDEWKKVAHSLNVSRARIQAILRNVQVSDRSEEDARYEMLLNWLKKMPKSTDKVAVLSNALIKGGRADLAEDVRSKWRHFQSTHGVKAC
ncbi:death domain-containing protein 1-like [Pecten maximus]|uniref:death domain-containing protein 1-like n=1 Tax=Pecten maximus TaxID=6579 RepID=UPI001458DB39|nr:death domain-containing protein 1-like [Pecten maximus]XP_033724900.1 death domain-containing protein 1-like [Pecten maximus]